MTPPLEEKPCHGCAHCVGEHCTHGTIKSLYAHLIEVPIILPRSNPFSLCGPEGNLWRPLS